MKVVSTRWLAVVAAATIVSVASLAVAQIAAPPAKVDPAKAEAAAKDRGEFMKANGAREKILVAILKGEATLDDKAKKAAADQAAAAKALLSKFPAGSGADVVKDSRAKAEIWQQWDKFTQLASSAVAATEASAAAAKSGDAKAFAEKEDVAVKACAACHKDYRAPRQP
jgi:cytochrome c556